MDIRPTEGFAELITEIKNNLGADVTNATELNVGHSNRLFCVETSTDQKLLAKFYCPDSKDGLKREFSAFQFLNSRGFASIPKAYFSNEKFQYGIYSFEKGATKSINDFTEKDLDAMIDFIVKLQSISPDQVKTDFAPAYGACFSIRDYTNMVYLFLNRFLNADATCRKYLTSVSDLKESDIKDFVDQAVQKATSSVTEAELNQPIAASKKRLNPFDFGAHNILFRANGSLCFIDFEDFGWDDPIRIVADFISHDQSRALPKELKDYFKKQYQQRANLDETDSTRLDIAIKIGEIEWLTYHLAAFTPETMNRRRFADIDFNEETYIKDQSDKLKIRIGQAQTLLASEL